MTKSRTTEIKVGITVLIGLFIFFAGFAWVKNWSVMSSQYKITMRFPTSAGLKTNDPVSVNGVKVGVVDRVIIDGNSVLVVASISGDVYLTVDAHPVIEMLELMGGKKVEIRQGVSEERWNPDNILPGTVNPDIAGALRMIGDAREEAGELLTNSNRLLVSMNNVLGDTAVQFSMKSTLNNINGVFSEMRLMLKENRENTRRIAQNLASVTSAVDSLLRDIRPGAVTSLDRVNGFLAVSDSAMRELTALLRELRGSRGLLAKFVSDTTFADRIDSTLSKVNRLVNDIQENGIITRIRLF